MDKYEFKATNLIAEAFEEHDVKFDVISRPGCEEVDANFSIDCGPNVSVRFFSTDNDNDVTIRVFSLISRIPREKRPRVLEACNVLNRSRYAKFYLDSDNDLNVGYDLPVSSADDAVGEMTFELFVRIMQTLDSEYSIFMRALYTDEALDVPQQDIRAEMMQELQKLRRTLEARLAKKRQEESAQDSGDTDSFEETDDFDEDDEDDEEGDSGDEDDDSGDADGFGDFRPDARETVPPFLFLED